MDLYVCDYRPMFIFHFCKSVQLRSDSRSLNAYAVLCYVRMQSMQQGVIIVV